MHSETGEIYRLDDMEALKLLAKERDKLIPLTEREANLLENIPNRHERRAALARARGNNSVADDLADTQRKKKELLEAMSRNA